MLLTTLEKCLSGGTYGYLKRDFDRLGPIKCSGKLRFLVFLNCTRAGQHWKGMGPQRAKIARVKIVSSSLLFSVPHSIHPIPQEQKSEGEHKKKKRSRIKLSC